MSSCGSYSSSCPEPIPVTINQTVIKIDDSPAMFRSENFSYGDSTDNRTFGLSYFPYEPKSVEVYLNSGAQRYNVDYTVQGQYVVMTAALVSGDQILVRYLSVDGTVASQTSTVGMLIGSAGSSLEGFLRMDGSTSHLWADYLPLKTWFWDTDTPITKASDDAASGSYAGDAANRYQRRKSLLSAYSATNFTLVLLQDTSYDGTSLVTLNKFISLGASV